MDRQEHYSQLMEQAVRQAVSSAQEWKKFLSFCAINYKYRFDEQMLIYAQRPDATACADYKTWNDVMHRWIQKGARGIWTLDVSSDTPKVRYLYDVSDTVETERSRPVRVWQIRDEYGEAVRTALAASFHVSESVVLSDQISSIIPDAAMKCIEQQDLEIELENYMKLIQSSILYISLSRCGIPADNIISPQDVSSISVLSTENLSDIGTVISSTSEEILRTIERTIRQKEREYNHDRTDIQRERRTFDSQSIDSGRETGDRAIRTDEDERPQREEKIRSDKADYDREADVPSESSGRGSTLPLVAETRGTGNGAGSGPESTDQRGNEGSNPGTDIRITDSLSYQLLSRLKSDCDYFLGAGGRSEKHLWAGNVRDQIAKMRELYADLPEKPDWITTEDIDNYAQRMAPPYRVAVYHHFENGFDDKFDYQTIEAAERAAQMYVNSTMEGEDGFAYDGAGVYDLQEGRWLHIVGDFPDERAIEQSAQAVADRESGEQITFAESSEAEAQAERAPLGPSPTVREIYEHYKPIVRDLVLSDTAYQNACRNSDEQNAVIEGAEAVKRAVLQVSDPQFMRLYYDLTGFHNNLHQEIFDETYPLLSETPQEITSGTEPQAAASDNTLTDLEKRALEIADRYKDLPLQNKIDIIAQTFDCTTGEIRTSPCAGRWRGTSDISIHFDNGAALFIGNRLTPKAKTVKVQTECVDSALIRYNPEIVQATKEAALPMLLQREVKDNEIAAQKDLKPYTLLNVEFNDSATEKNGSYLGWYYVTLAVDGKICTHLETGLNHAIADGKVSDTPTRPDYFTAGALKETDVDYVFDNVGFSSASTLYTLPLRKDVRERAEKTLAERERARSIPEQLEQRDPLSDPYQTGDMVYIDDTEYQISRLDGDYIELLDVSADYPTPRMETRESFEHAILKDARNGAITEYLSAELELFDSDMQDILSEGLLSYRDKQYISLWIKNGLGNTPIAQRLSERFAGTVDSMELVTGETADYRATTTGIEVEILREDGSTAATLQTSWQEISGALRAFYIRESDGFTHDPVIEMASLKGTPIYRAGDEVTLPIGDREIKGTIGYVGETDVRVDTGSYSWSHETINRKDFDEALRRDERNAGLFSIPEKDIFEIYQLKDGTETRDYRWLPYDALKAEGLDLNRQNYRLVYAAPLAPDTTLESIFTQFNIDHPADFHGHSLSVSDIVVLHQNGQDTAHYVDSIGFTSVPEFLRDSPQLPTPDRRESGSDPENGVQMSFFGTENEQASPAFSQQEIDTVLRMGGNTDRLRERVITVFEKQKSFPEIVSDLRTLYHGGNGFLMENGRIAAWYDIDGIRLSRGGSARYDTSAQILSWQDAAERIEQLLEDGQFAAQKELADADGFERSRLARDVWDLYRDFSEEGRTAGYLPCLSENPGHGFPEGSAWLTDKLQDPDFRAALLVEYQQFLDAYQSNRNILRFRHRNADSLLKDLRDLDLPRRSFAPGLIEIPPIQQFITEDEIDAALSAGSNFSDSKNRVFNFFTGESTDKEKADFLKREYGTGGRSHALSDAAYSGEDHDSRGLRYSKRDCPDVRLTWDRAAKRIDGLIRAGRYLTGQETTEREKNQAPVSRVGDAITVGSEPAHEISVTVSDSEYEAIQQAVPEKPKPPKTAAGRNFAAFAALFPDIVDRQYSYLRLQAGESMMPLTIEWIGENEISVSHHYIQEGDLMYDPEITYLIDTDAGTMEALTYQQDNMGMYQDVYENPDAPNQVLRASLNGFTGTWFRNIRAQGYVRERAVRSIDGEDVNFLVPAEEASRQEPELSSPAEAPQAENFRITAENYDTTPKQKYKANAEAIRTVKTLETEGRTATPEEQEILSRYSGWGGIPQAFDPDAKGWETEYEELSGLLTPEEYRAARESSLTSFYTPPSVIRAVYSALENMGFASGKILEPSCGVGRFFGLLPESMTKSQLYGVELDSVTGRIAKHLYPNADIRIQGFEKTDFPDNFFDIAVGNIPFGGYQVPDPRYDAERFLVHDYFFARTLDKVRPGGIIAYVTSSGTLDKQDESARRYIAQRARLLGAVRLPYTSMLKDGGTEVTADILFLQKLDAPSRDELEWLHVGQTEDGITLNRYFISHPDMMMGTMGYSKHRMYGREGQTALFPAENWEEKLAEAVRSIHGQYVPALPSPDVLEKSLEIPMDGIRMYGYTVRNGKLYLREPDGFIEREKINAAQLVRAEGLIRIRDAARRLIDAESNDLPDGEIESRRRELNVVYDAFVQKHGAINEHKNGFFREDADFALLCGLEIQNEKEKTFSKADIFTKRTIRAYRVPEHTDSVIEALQIALNQRGYVDLDYISKLTGKPAEDVLDALKGVIYKNPETERYETSDEYLSGNVRRKLRIARFAAESDSAYSENVDALEKVQPKDLTADEIELQMGSTLFTPQDIKDFLVETLEPTTYMKSQLDVTYIPEIDRWEVFVPGVLARNHIPATKTYGTKRVHAYDLAEQALNKKIPTVRDKYGNTYVVNQEETTAARNAQKKIIEGFQAWMYRDPQRRDRIVRKYNEKFNSVVQREFDGSYLTFSGMNPAITLREHQKNAVARGLARDNLLLAHCVGAGKTYTMTAIAMESKRLGLSNKTMIVVPGHLLYQWGGAITRLYPGAKVLIATKDDFEKKKRQRFTARIAYGDYDIIVMSHSGFGKIGVSEQMQTEQIREEMDAVDNAIDSFALRSTSAERLTVKQLERRKKQLEATLEKLSARSKKDDLLDFEQLGIDTLMVDESDEFKNLMITTKMGNVSGISQEYVQKTMDMYLKCRCLAKANGGEKGVVFATGTPISNSMAELYSLQRYLRPDVLKETGVYNFDAWASTFGKIIESFELSPDGKTYRYKSRFGQFTNLPELFSMYWQFADVKTREMLNLPIPKKEMETIVAQPSMDQKALVQDIAEHFEAIHSGSKEYNALEETGRGRRGALDMRLLDPDAEDFPGSKVNLCVKKVFEIWEKTKENRSTQLVFCDLSTPKKENSDGFDDIYHDIRRKLVGMGIPSGEIAFIHDADGDKQKDDLFEKVRRGDVRILMGSTFKMGAGMNVQDKIIALHHLDAPWRPKDLEQREGRALRVGNENESVSIYKYVTTGTFDAYMWQMLEQKWNFVSQIQRNEIVQRTAADIDPTMLDYMTVKMLATDDPRVREREELRVRVTELRQLKSHHISEQKEMNHLIKRIPKDIAAYREDAKNYQIDIQTRNNFPMDAPFILKGTSVTGQKAGQLLLDLSNSAEQRKIGSYRGFDLLAFQGQICVSGASNSWIIAETATGTVTKIRNVLDGFEQREEYTQNEIKKLELSLSQLELELQKPFEYEQELNQKISRLTDLDMQLQAEAGSNKQVFVDGEEVGGSDAPERRKTLEEELREITARPASYEKNQAKEVMEFAR